MNTTNEIKILKIQTTIPKSSRQKMLQQLNSLYGEPTPLNQMFTKYRNPKRSIISVIIDEPVIFPDSKRSYTITSLGDIDKSSQKILKQQAVISHVTGNAHEFAASLGLAPSHTWIERGEMFTQDKVNIKVFDLLNANEEIIDPEDVVISIEVISEITSTSITASSKKIENIYKTICPNIPQYNKFLEHRNGV